MSLYAASKGEVVINEVGWAGTNAASTDEIIELYNNTDSSIVLTDWELYDNAGLVDMTFSGSIPAGGYYLIENDENCVSDVAGDLVDSSISLDNTNGENLILKDASGNIIDQVDCSGGWFNTRTSTDNPTMEKITPTRLGNDPDNWADVSSDTNTWNGHDADDKIFPGSPKSQNTVYVADTAAPSVITNLTALTGAVAGEINLQWTSPGTDGTSGYCGCLSSYTVKYATFPVDNLGGDTTAWWTHTNTTLYSQTWEVSPQGTLETFTVEGLTSGATYYFAVRTTDGAGNTSALDQRITDTNQDKAYASTNIDNTAPGTVTDLVGQPVTNPKEVELTWTSPGDDGYTGNNVALSSYTVRYATFSISDLSDDTTNWWSNATSYIQDWSVSAQGTGEIHIATMPFAGTTYYFAARTTDEAGNTSDIDDNAKSVTNQAESLSKDYSRTVVINELSWFGTTHNTSDEWIELYNNTGGIIDFTSGTGWTIETEDGPEVNLTGTISSKGYYIIEDSTETIFDLTEDHKENFGLNNTDEKLILKDGNGIVIDQVDCTDERLGTGEWYAGDNTSDLSMERINSNVSGDVSTNWANATSNNGHVDDGGNTINGTPGVGNSVSPDLISPAAISDLTALTGSSEEGEITLTWTAPGDEGTNGAAVSYTIKCSSLTNIGANNFSASKNLSQFSSSSSTAPLSYGTTQQMTVTGLSPGVTYWFAMKAIDEGGNSGFWSTTTVNTANYDIAYDTDPAVPSNLAAASVDTGTISVSWDANSEQDFNQYRLQASSYSPTAGFGNDLDTTFSNIETVEFSDEGLETGNTYFYRIRAEDNNENYSIWSATKSAYPEAVVPSTPTAFSGTALSSTTINWTWANVASETGYRIKYATDTTTLVKELDKDITVWPET
ncbi:MAG: lamin tail domain-containing protein, partial [Elusimicrobia bacterium]|nr:lamin tail domain-containing protein [Elusimicrobiota bacterium]